MELWKTEMKEGRKKEKEQKERTFKNVFCKNNNTNPFIKCLVSAEHCAKIFERIMRDELF